jgi:hypothetical protein
VSIGPALGGPAKRNSDGLANAINEQATQYFASSIMATFHLRHGEFSPPTLLAFMPETLPLENDDESKSLADQLVQILKLHADDWQALQLLGPSWEAGFCSQ